MAKGKRQFFTNAKDLSKFNRKKNIVTNTRQNIHVIGGRTTRSLGTRPGLGTMRRVPGTVGGDQILAPCPPGTVPCGMRYLYNTDGFNNPGQNLVQRCCSLTDNSRGRTR